MPIPNATVAHTTSRLVFERTLHTLGPTRPCPRGNACIPLPKRLAYRSVSDRLRQYTRHLSAVTFQRRGNAISRAIFGQDPAHQIGSIKCPTNSTWSTNPSWRTISSRPWVAVAVNACTDTPEVLRKPANCRYLGRSHTQSLMQWASSMAIAPICMARITSSARIHHPLGAEEQRPATIANAIKDLMVGLIGQTRVHGRRLHSTERSEAI